MSSAFVSSINQYSKIVNKGEVSAKSFSNIALIKYWGKHENQIPANPSLSFTLSEANTVTELEFKQKKEKEFSIQVYLDNKLQPSFVPKIEKFFNSIKKFVPFITEYDYIIHTKNSFPHSSGIASSASGMSALAKCIVQMEELFGFANPNQLKKASFLARLGSGSASRSIYPGVVVWGENESILGSSNEYSIEINNKINSKFLDYKDCILLVHKGVKKVSSTVGHQLMHHHPYAKNRFLEAHKNLDKLLITMRDYDLENFIKITELEALSLHAMMMTSNPYFILMEPNTVKAIKEIWKFREQSNVPICFTLDAGANVHVLYPKDSEEFVLPFINDQLKPLCYNGEVLFDYVNKEII